MVTSFSFDNLPYPVRGDIAQAYDQYWQRLAQPGNWFSAEQRVAIAREVRNANNCSYCAERKKALSPYHFPGEHKHSGVLPAALVDAVHRVITDQSRITRDYIQNSDFSEEQYVELVGVAVTVFSIDEAMRALGLPPAALPPPQQGAPDHYRPAQAIQEVGFIAMIPAAAASGKEQDLWPGGRTANVLRALSLVPDALRHWQDVAAVQYLNTQKLMNFGAATGRAMNRMQMELIAGRVSSYNECFY